MKSYTDVEQSKKLAEILPLESADMAYLWHSTSDNPTWRYDNVPMILADVPINDLTCDALPCWSLASLLSVLPSVIKRKGKRMFLTLEKAGAYNLYYKSPDRLDELWETKEDVIDACVTMIENLHELKML